MKTNRYKFSKDMFAVLICLFIVESAWSQDSYDSLLISMQSRQAQLEEALLAAGTCLGEKANGYIEANYNCQPEVQALAEAENKDRSTLYALMGRDLGLDLQVVEKKWAEGRVERYIPGVQREIALSDGKLVWWDGFPVDPRKNDVPRILTQQYATIHAKADASSPIVRDNLRQYESYGVIGNQKDAAGLVWFKITKEYVPKVKPQNWNPSVLGWISEKEAIPWKRALVMRFTNSLQRDPSLFFTDPETVLALAKQPLPERKTTLEKLYADFEVASVPKSSGAIAIEPIVGKKQEQIVMYPVLDYYGSKGQDIYIDGMFARLLDVAAQTRSGAREVKSSRYVPVDIMFVMDTTSSMKPYLEKVLQVVKQFADEEGNDNIKLGFIGYQDVHEKFEYAVKPFTNELQSAAQFSQTLQDVKARTIPVKEDDIPEAVFQGVNLALDSKQWRTDSVKLIFLVGDAPGREDVFTLKELRDKAFTRKINLCSFYIANSKGAAKYGVLAKQHYRQLSSSYEGAYGTSREVEHMTVIDSGSGDEFAALLLNSFNAAVKSIEALAGQDSDQLSAEEGSIAELIFQQATLLLADNSIPDQSISGWVSDKVLTNPGREALAPMILLTEAELDELDQRVRELKDIGVAALRGDGGTTLDFFDLVEKNSRFTMVDPSAVNFRDAFSIPLGIDTLPYNSDIMATTREEFHNTDRVQEFVRSMNNKLRHYEDLRRAQGNPDVWKKLNIDADEHDRVVGVELNQLP